jgi:hypothetical protein
MPVRSRTCEDAQALRTPRNTLVLEADTRTRVDSTRTCVLRCRGSGTVSDESGRRCHLPEQALSPRQSKGRCHNQGGCGEKGSRYARFPLPPTFM